MFKQIELASARLHGNANMTPVLTNRTLDRLVGANVFFKCENFQRTGAFKFRGAWNSMSKLSQKQRDRGVLTYSSGNHGQAIALVGQLLGISTTVVMPNNAPLSKRAATEGYGAHVMAYDPTNTTREALAEELQMKHGYTLIPPFDHADVIAGQGTAALELFDQVPDLDMLLVPCGGGGLLSGSAVVTKHVRPSCAVIGIEPKLADDATRSFHSKTLQSVKNPQTIADGTRTHSLGRLTFPLVLANVDDMRTVSEEAIIDAVKFFFYRFKLVIEPSGALGLAALLSDVVKSNGRVGVILSGGNLDGPTMMKILSG